jgi:hypothetical protein
VDSRTFVLDNPLRGSQRPKKTGSGKCLKKSKWLGTMKNNGMSASLSTTASEGGISSDHWLDFAIKEKIEGGKEMPVRRCVVIHFTGGHSAKSSIGGGF